MEEAKEMKCYKRLKCKRFVQISGLCSPQFLIMSYLPKRFMHLCRALYGDAVLVHRFGPPIWPPEINKNNWGSLFLLKLFLFIRELAYVRINMSSNTWNGYTAENQGETFFQRDSIPILVSRTVKTQISVFSKWNMLREWKLVQRFIFYLSSTLCK